MSTTIECISLGEVIEAVIASRGPLGNDGLSDRVYSAGLYFWEDIFETVLQLADINQLSIASGGTCSDLDLPQGSTWVECFAAALDIHPQFKGSNHLSTLQEMFKDFGLRAE